MNGIIEEEEKEEEGSDEDEEEDQHEWKFNLKNNNFMCLSQTCNRSTLLFVLFL